MAKLTNEELRYHRCDREDRWPEHDGRGIFLCYVCDKCRKVKLGTYRPEILRYYTAADVDEPIEEEDY